MPKRRKNVPIDPVAELARIKEQRALTGRTRLYKSKLDKYRHELLVLRAVGCSCKDLSIWLAGQRVKTAESTIRRWLHIHLDKVAARQLSLLDDGGQHGKR